ncbi:patched domain-containing protein 3 isoform X2 [Eurytemora carolleeae]|uniref:patched domain-containing protein 3 isoform X1 n=1 Tax=Eurytemora carolleeae TaxID=1294199 RepID=UPI000C76B8D2|nr:patched domain-containing protein 3 isoform X1 [Eurytemora carolleeae]XP_023339854.1 patched domain-containing protein 3 isoform X2 [Eurytemora carolleeae]|eukprot:XP_023339853.1 patched domain-containing protein 3-like isoform X1 [Eurytemora affinis]
MDDGVLTDLKKSRSFVIHRDKTDQEEVSVFQRFVRTCQTGVIGSLEKFFIWYGELVATHPWKAILVCFLATLLGGLGLLRFHEEGDAASIVIPTNSEFRRNIDFLDNNFPREIRVHSVVYVADNVLTPSVIQYIYKQRKDLQNLETDKKTFQDMCIRVPILKFPENGLGGSDSGKKSTVNNFENDDWGDEFKEFDEIFEQSEGGDPFNGGLGNLFSEKEVDVDLLMSWSNTFYPEPYCSAVKATETACFELNIVELWGDQGHYSESTDLKIAFLTQADILDKINNKNISQIFLKEKNFKELLGDVKYNKEGEIIGAGSVELKFYTTVNISSVKLYGTASRGEKIDQASYDFEGALIKLFTTREGMPRHMTSYVNVQRQFFESFVGQTFKDADKLVLGYVLVFIYVNLMLSKFNCVEQRIGLSVVGILSVAMGMILAYGVCSLFGLFYSAAHTVIPFLLLGIGIDNIFVITQAFNTLEASSVPLSLVKRIGQTMGHAGVAVSVTTFTDVIAFFVGSNTVLPGLASFCVYSAVSIFAIYALQVTHFVAWMSLDEKRMRAHRDGCLCCVTHKNFQSFEFSRKSILNKAFRMLGLLITNTVFKIFIILLTITFIVFGIWGALSLTQEYQPEWLLPPESEIAQWFGIKAIYYPSHGEPGFVMIPKIDMSTEFFKVEQLVQTLRSRDKNIEWVNTWTADFRNYVNTFTFSSLSFEELMQDEDFFRDKFTQFLYSPKGAAYQPYFEFGEELECGKPAPDLLLQAIPFGHLRFERSSEWIPAMQEVEQIVQDAGFSNYSFPMALTYINWKTDAIVGIELFRNIGIALICIFTATLCTLGSWRGSMFVMMCVLLTCVDVSGFMHWWGLTIDITSMNILIISVGLCVDFCAHIVHGFLIGKGTRHERVVFVMENIAPAVLNGGFSSLLALSLLVTSRSHIFISFFKIFFMICTFGLFHGLVTLPVVLTLIGPEDPDVKREKKEKKAAQKENKENLKAESFDMENKSWLTRTRVDDKYLRSIKSDTNIVLKQHRKQGEHELRAHFEEKKKGFEEQKVLDPLLQDKIELDSLHTAKESVL